MPLAELHLRAEALYAERRRELDRHAAELKRIDQDIHECNGAIKIAAAGLAGDKIALAETVLDIYGSFASAGQDRQRCLGASIDAVAGRGVDLLRMYQATKNYAHWHGQDCQHSYGMGPKHGTVIFSIGLKTSVRDRVLRGGQDVPLTKAEADACVYYLMNLERIQAEREAAKVMP